ncbi:hypothetical protein LTR78_009875 [Recurvomyces mirabilis]|uniref:Uncharacterized protein n=1 Tax=Recurvomyces mirabilis TaxID=574656 RepID=A0AAE0TNS2_9PEZI|nr:hypothetical protein LTR78_009875 [Recurvomyces mirabilis]KAK5150550.1 hypothetical protein LTS14_010044 [Recurvomyces mirabilis]
MAPPQKRRKVVETADFGDVVYADEVSAGTHSHVVEHISPIQWHSAPTRQVPQHIEEVHLQIHNQAIGAVDSYAELRKRQAAGTGSSSLEQVLSVTVAAAVAIDGSTTAVSTTTSSISGQATFSSTATISTVVSTAALSISPSAVISSSASTSVGSSAISSSSENSTQSSTSSGTGISSTSSANTSDGLIGLSPAAASGTVSGTSTNSTSATTTRSGSLTTGLSATGSTSQNLTTSEYLFLSDGKTFTTSTTINLASSASRTASSDESSTTDSSSTSSLTLGAAFYLSTLEDGTLVTISRSNEAYATTFANGFQTTIPAASGSYLTTTGSDGSALTSYQSPSPTSTNLNGQSVTSAPVGVGAGVNGQSTQTSASSSSTSSAASSNDNSNNNNNNTAPPGTIAGGVVGGAAGLAVILLIAMLFLRWSRGKAQGGHQALPANTGVSPTNDQVSSVSRGPGMAERAGLMPVFGAVPALFRHQNRSQDTAGAGTERSFERVAGTGRKMPSSFSPGMSAVGAGAGVGGGGGAAAAGGVPYAMPLQSQENNLSTTSFYRDSTGFYGGEGSSPPENPFEPGTASAAIGEGGAGVAGAAAGKEEMTLSPGPRRTPTVHGPGPYRMSTPAATASSPGMEGFGPAGTSPAVASFERSETPGSLEHSRGSRFTEEV